MSVTAADLVGHWRHSHEEDRGDRLVFRPESYAFPLSRGRVAFKLDADGRAMRYPIGADDRSGAVAGKWRLDGARLVITDAGAAAPSQIWKIVSAARDRLVVERA